MGINEKAVVPEKQSEQDGEPALDANKDKEVAENEDKEKEAEDKVYMMLVHLLDVSLYYMDASGYAHLD